MQSDSNPLGLSVQWAQCFHGPLVSLVPLSHGLYPFGLPMAQCSPRSTVAGTVGHKSCRFPRAASLSAHWVPFWVFPADLLHIEGESRWGNAYIHTYLVYSHGLFWMHYGVTVKSGCLSLSDISCWEITAQSEREQHRALCVYRVWREEWLCIVEFNGCPTVSSESESCRHRAQHNTDRAEWAFLWLLGDWIKPSSFATYHVL